MWPNKIAFFTLFLLNLFISSVKCNVHGCGGFIRSHADIDFSKVEVNLLTKSGVSKDKVEGSLISKIKCILL